MEDRDLTKYEAAALLSSKDKTGKAVDRLVNAGRLKRHVIPHVGKRYKESEVLAAKVAEAAGKVKPEQRPALRPALQEQDEPASPAHRGELAFATPGTNPLVAAKAFNDFWSLGGMDATLRQMHRPGDPVLDWPLLTVSPRFEPDGIFIAWDKRSGLTEAFVRAMVLKDVAAAQAELAKTFPEAARMAEGIVAERKALPGLPRRV